MHDHTSPSPGVPAEIVQIVLTADQIAQRVGELAVAIERDVHPDRDIHLVGILTGAFVFMADLVRAMTTRVTLDFMAVSSYGSGVRTSGEVRVLKDLTIGIEDRHVVIVEDIVDTGVTLAYLQGLLRTRAPRSLRTATLLSKTGRRQVPVPVDYVGFEIDDRFVVGYGLDYAHRFRNLPYVAVVEDPASGAAPAGH